MAKKRRKPRKRANSFSIKRIIKRLKKHIYKYLKYILIGCFFIFAVFLLFSKCVSRSGTNRSVIASSEYNGIDVSKYQGKIDWEKVADDKHIQFVYIKASEGVGQIDKKYKRNFKDARNAGIKVGSYHFFIGRKPAKEQFDNFKKCVNKNNQDLIPVVDVEEMGNRHVSRVQLQNNLQEFMELVKKEYGKYPILYSQYRFYNKMLAPEFNKYFIFIARYSNQEPVLKGGGKYNIWQYSEKGRIKGIKGNVDMNRFGNGTSLSDIEL